MKKIPLLIIGLFLISKPVLAADDATNKKILKDAIVGAVTGAVATEATQPPQSNFKPKKWHKHHHDDDDDDQGENHHHKKDKKRPHGWDMGKKTGWGNKDVPPGLAKKDE